MKYWIKNGMLLLKKNNTYVAEQQDLFINDKKIESLDVQTVDNISEYIQIDVTGHLIMPGLINSHTHAYMNFMKNSADDLSFDKWLFDRILPIEAKIHSDDFYWSTLLGCIEMIKTGTTTYVDMHISDGQCAKSAKDSGMRAFIGKCIRGEDLYGDAYYLFEKAMEEKERYENDLIRFVLSPHSIYACSEKMLRQILAESENRNMLKHIHLSESETEFGECVSRRKKTPVEFLQEIGFLDNKTLAAHCVKVTDKDIDILKSYSVNVVSNPSSNAKLGNGIAPITKMLNKNVNVCLGTDSSASNNTLNMFREMNMFSLIHKAQTQNSTALLASEVLDSVSENPAKALGLDGKIGVIKEGSFADLIFIDLRKSSLFPNNNITASLCYSANGSEVTSVMINGEFVMRNGEMLSVDEERVYFEINRIVNKYFKA